MKNRLKNTIKYRNDENAQAALERANSVIGMDKKGMSDECRKMVVRDFTHIAREYFDLKTPLAIEISDKDGEYSVQINFKADRVKTFYILS